MDNNITVTSINIGTHVMYILVCVLMYVRIYVRMYICIMYVPTYVNKGHNYLMHLECKYFPVGKNSFNYNIPKYYQFL